MSRPIVIQAKRRRVETLAREIDALVADGHDVIVSIGDGVKPERVVKLVQASVQDYKVQIAIRHPEFKEYFQNAVAGASIGGGIGAAAVLAAIAAGNPVTLGPALAAIGLGALLGGAIGAGITPIARVTIYKYKGETRLKFAAAS